MHFDRLDRFSAYISGDSPLMGCAQGKLLLTGQCVGESNSKEVFSLQVACAL